MTSTVLKSQAPGGRLTSGLPRPLSKSRLSATLKKVKRFNLQSGDKQLFLILCALLEDVGNYSDISYATNRFKAEGRQFMTVELPKLGKALYRALADGHWTPVPSFGSRGGRYVYPRFLSGLFAKVFLPDGTLREDPCISSVKFINQVCAVAYKADDASVDPDLGRDKLLNLIETERDLKVNWNEDIWNTLGKSNFVRVATQIARTVLPNPPESFRGHPGPGATADLSRTDVRYDAYIPYDPRNVDLIGQFGFFFNENHLYGEGLPRYPNAFADPAETAKSRTSEVVLVPKDSRGPRVIAKEPWALQWMQQGIKDWFVEAVERNPLSAGRVNFTYQEVNAEIARVGSATKAWSTLDLKDASDRVTLGMVHSLFSTNPRLLDLLERTRSEFTSLQQVKEELGNCDDLPHSIRMEKFAPMGSAMCFPVLSLCCFSFAVAAIHMKTRWPFEKCAELVRVYGDDVCVATPYAQTVAVALEYVGLKINWEKSFIDSHFLESCGNDCFKGHRITPIRVKKVSSRFRINDDDDPTVLVSLLERGNAFLKEGYVSASKVCYEMVEGVLGPLVFGDDDTPVLSRWCMNDAHLELNYAEDRGAYARPRRHCHESLTCWGLAPVEVNLGSTEYGHLLRVWAQLGKGNPLPKLGEFTLPKRSKLVRRGWEPDAATSTWLPL